GIRGFHVTGVQTCALPIWPDADPMLQLARRRRFAEHRRAHHGPIEPAALERCFRGELVVGELLAELRHHEAIEAVRAVAHAIGRSEERRVGSGWSSGWEAS